MLFVTRISGNSGAFDMKQRFQLPKNVIEYICKIELHNVFEFNLNYDYDMKNYLLQAWTLSYINLHKYKIKLSFNSH